MIDKLITLHEKHYKKMILVPFIILLLSFVVIGNTYRTTGDFVEKGVSLKGGSSISFLSDASRTQVESELPYSGTKSVRTLSSAGTQVGLVVDVDTTDSAELDAITTFLEENYQASDFSVETIGSSLGESFFRQTIIAMLIAFLLMGLVVFIYFRKVLPSIAIILAALSDIITTLAIVDLLHIKLSAAGIAAFLMLVGYSVDTDIILTTKLLKNKEGSVNERMSQAFKTGMMMTLTTLTAVTVGLIFTQSDVIQQILFILLIGLFIDIMNTWVQNASILRWVVHK